MTGTTNRNWYNENQVNNINKPNNTIQSSTDPWKNRNIEMKCNTCMYYVPKKIPSEVNVIKIGRCRRNAPAMNGYPVVYPSDWCGDHKIDENKLLCE